MIRLAKKVDAGAQFVQTQYCFDLTMLKSFMAKARDMGLDKRCYILVGVGPLASAKAARWMRANVAGVHIPDSVIARLERAADQKAEGKRICIEMIRQLREEPGVAGVHVMAYRQEQTVSEIVHEFGRASGPRALAARFHPEDAAGREPGGVMTFVIASAAKQSRATTAALRSLGLLRFARNDVYLSLFIREGL